MKNVYILLSILFALLFSVFLNYYINFSSAQIDVTVKETNNKSKLSSDSYLMNETNYFFVKYIQKSNGLTDSIINKTVIYDSNDNELTIEYNNSDYYKTLTIEEENLLKKTLLDLNFFGLPSSYPISKENIKDKRYNSYNLTVTIDNKTNSVYWIDKEYTVIPSELYFINDKIEDWFKSASIKEEKPTSIVTPICGPTDGFDFKITTNGFAPDRIVHWELLDKEQQPALLGYFETNNTGGFNETSYIADVLPGKYQLHLYDDKDNDAQEDFVGKEIFTGLSIPCEPTHNNTSLQVTGGYNN